ncbi:MAG: coproporphyrinogen III oxidase [Azospira oryzae]|jgi:oxygen-independent coproporphyrinogen-3 oxidase|nr:MAG: coproporphyrinogen III oxidase [Azospira oryzae]
MAGLYIHIPFCKQACHYCDFHFSTNQSTRRDLIACINRELELQKDYLHQEIINTIYFGGGTPSLLSAEELNKIVESIHSIYRISEQAEITLEANPDDLSEEKLKELRLAGVNRLSIGIQSFNDAILAFFNRAHNSTEAFNSVARARAAGFDNISIDLMYAIPGQSHELWQKNMELALSLHPEHISSYTLTIEEKTAFGQWAKRGKLKGVEEEFAAHEFELLMNTMSTAGYEHYEISNFCKPGYHSKHNSNYWRQQNYLGIGPSAHSYNGVSRQFNVSNNAAYIRLLHENKIPFELETLTPENKINEFIFTTLRTSWGCNLNYLKTHLNYDLIKSQGPYLKNLQEKDLISINDERLLLTHKGKFLADQIASDLFVVS